MMDEKEQKAFDQALDAARELGITVKEQQAVIDAIIPPEAVYSFSTTALNKDGMGATWTIRARVGEEGKQFFHRADNFLQYAIQHGWTLPQRAPAPASAPQPAPGNGNTPAPSPAPEIVTDGGTARAILMKVGKSYAGNKPQLQFEVEGMEHPLSYTRSVVEMMKLLAPVGAYSPEMLTDGKKYGVNYLVEWKLGDPNAEGKRYRNIIAVKPA